MIAKETQKLNWYDRSPPLPPDVHLNVMSSHLLFICGGGRRRRRHGVKIPANALVEP